MTATNMCYNFVGFGQSPPIYSNSFGRQTFEFCVLNSTKLTPVLEETRLHLQLEQKKENFF